MCLMCLMCLSNACSSESALACKMQACLLPCLKMSKQGLAKGPLVNGTDTQETMAVVPFEI